jgi:hypothetical protein
MALSFTEVEASLARSARQLVRKPSSSLPSGLTQGLTFLLNHFLSGDPQWGYVDGLTFVEWGKRKSRRLWFRGLVDFLVEGDCILDVFEAELLPSAAKDRLDTYIFRIGRRGQEHRRVPYRDDQVLRKELAQVGQWEWAHIFRADRSQVP